MMLPLCTERLLIREFTADDCDGLAAVYGDPKVIWWEPAPYSAEQTAAALTRILGQYASEGMAEYAIVLRSTGEIIGDSGPVLREVEGVRLPELGWDLRSDCWGHGYATEAARALLGHVAELGITRIYSFITPGNAPSRAVAERLGMTIERRALFADVLHDLWALDLVQTLRRPV